MPCRALGEKEPAGVAGPELKPVGMRALKMKTEQLRQPSTHLRVWQRLEPVGVALMQIRAHVLWQPPVGGLANQDVAEAVTVAAAHQKMCRAQQLLAHQRRQVPGQRGSQIRRDELCQRRRREAVAESSRVLECEPLRRAEQVEPRGQKRLDAARKRRLV